MSISIDEAIDVRKQDAAAPAPRDGKPIAGTPRTPFVNSLSKVTGTEFLRFCISRVYQVYFNSRKAAVELFAMVFPFTIPALTTP